MPLDEASFHAATGRGFDCRVGAILRDLDAEDLATLTRVLADASVSDRAISVVLSANGHYVGETTVGKHRRRGCRCPA